MAPKQGEQLDLLMEPDNRMDKFAVCVKINEKNVGYLKKSTSGRFAKTIFYFLRSDAYSSAWAKVTGKRWRGNASSSQTEIIWTAKICTSLT